MTTTDDIAMRLGFEDAPAPEPKRFWAYVELMGHKQLAGLLTEEQLGGATMLRLDVPETTKLPAYTRLFNAGSVYGITPCTEATARAVAERVSSYNAPLPIAIGKSGDPAQIPARSSAENDDDEPFEDFPDDDSDDNDGLTPEAIEEGRATIRRHGEPPDY